MSVDSLIAGILHDDALTAGLNDPEARMLIEWLVEQAEGAARLGEPAARGVVEQLCRRARGIRRFLVLWCHCHDHPAAVQLAGTERYPWPLPTSSESDPCELLERILRWETARASRAA